MSEEKSAKEELYKKLIQIDKEQRELKRKKEFLIRERPWYRQSNNIIGLFAIIIPLFIWLYSIYKTEKLELTCSYSDPVPLTSFNKELQEKILVTYKGIPVNNIGKIKIKLQNTGSKGLTRNDFADGPIDFKISSGNTRILSDTLKKIPFLLDVVKGNNSKQKNDILTLISQNSSASFSYLPSLINKDAFIEFEVFISDINNAKTIIEGNIKDGIIISEKYSEIKEKSSFLNIGDALIQFFGSEWLCTVILVIASILTLVKTFALILDGFEFKLFDISFAILFLFCDSILIIVLISVLMNNS